MFEKGDYIVYGTSGICEVTDIRTMELSGVPKDKLYYVLSPYSQKGSTLFTPVDNRKTIMRKLITKKDAVALIDDMPNVEELWVENEKMREDVYKQCIRSCECRQWIRVIKTLNARKLERAEQGKKISSTDEKYLDIAKDHLLSEFSILLEIPKNDMEQYIADRLDLENAV